MIGRRMMLAGAAIMAGGSVFSQTMADDPWLRDFERFMTDGMKATGTPGSCVAMVKQDRLLFSRGFGFADVKSGRPVTPDTIFHIASLAKTITGTATMMLWQEKRFALDEPIAPYLDFSVTHPRFPDVPITFRHLFTHTSGISGELYSKVRFSSDGDPTLPLRDFLVGYLSPGGQWYDPDSAYTTKRPGSTWSYSNVAVALLGYLAGRIGPAGLDTQVRERLLLPLGMRATAWKSSDLPGRDIATSYRVSNGAVEEIPMIDYPDWPAGMIRTSVRDFAQFVKIFANRGRVDGRQYLASGTLDVIAAVEPVRPDTPDLSVHQGLTWFLTDTAHGLRVGHSGLEPGSNTRAAIELQNGVGALVFANVAGNPAIVPFQQEIITRLLDKARQA
jgi:CubicO group peptidase (beta-lactamase class C family)